jgi:hypothetical protein
MRIDPKQLKGGTLTGNITLTGSFSLPSLLSETTSLDFLALSSDNSIKKRTLGTMALLSSTNFYDKTNADSTFLKLTGGVMSGTLTVNAQVNVGSTLNITGTDLTIRNAARGAGGRALVHDGTNGVTINYANDFTGGVTIGSNVFFSNTAPSYLLNVNFGIGTATPSEKLSVLGNISTTGMFKLNASFGTTGQFIKNTGTLSEWANITPADITGLYLGTKTLMEDTRTSFGNGIYTYRTYNGQTTNNPTGLFYGQILNWGAGTSGGQAQVAVGWTPSDNNYIAFRSLRDSADNWYSWKRIYHEGYKPTTSDITGLSTYTGLTTYLPLTGGTLTGTLTVPTINATGSLSFQYGGVEWAKAFSAAGVVRFLLRGAANTTTSGSSGLFQLGSFASATKRLFMGFDDSIGATGAGFISAVNEGVSYLPIVLNQLGGSVIVGNSTNDSKFIVNGGSLSTNYISTEARLGDGSIHLLKTVTAAPFEAVRAMNMDTSVGSGVRFVAAISSQPYANTSSGKGFLDFTRFSGLGDIDFSLSLTNGSGAGPVEYLRVKGLNGNVLIGTTTDSGYKLDVFGSFRVTGGIYFGSTAIFSNNKFIYWNDTLGNPRRLLGLASNGFHVGDVDNVIENSVTNLWAKVQHCFFVNGDLKVQFANDGFNYFKGSIQAYGVLNTQIRTDSAGGIAGKIQSVDGNSVWMGAESNHTLNLITNNIIRGTFDTDGNFGIGITTPSYLGLQIHKGSVSAGITLSNAANNWSIYTGDSTINAFVITDNQWGERFRIGSSGYVGIGTTPQTKLHVGGGYGQLNGLAIGSLVANEYGTVLFTENYGNGVTHLFSLKNTIGYGDLALVEYGGRVGIGTARPSETLDVRGVFRLSNNGFVSGTSGSFLNIWHDSSTGNSQVNLQAWSNGGNTYDSIVLQPLSGEVRIGVPTGSYYKLNVGGTAKIDGLLRLGENIAFNCNQFGYWQDSAGTDRRIIGMNAAHSIYLGDIDRTISNSNLLLLANSTHWFYVGQANIAVITSSGLDVKGNYYQNGVLKTFFDGNYNSLSNLPNLGSYVLTSSIVQDELSVNATNSNAVAAKVLFSIKDTIYANMNSGLSGKANVSHTHDWSSITGKPTFFSGNYNDLSNKPVFFDGNYNSLSNLPNLGSYVLTSSIVQDELSVNATNSNAVAAKVLSSIKDTIYANMNSGLSGKANASHTHDWSSITGKPTFFSGNYNDLSNKPVFFDGNYNNLSNRPDLSGYLTQANVVTDSANVNGTNLSPISSKLVYNYVNDLWGAVNSKAAATHTHDWSTITGKPTFFDGNYNNLTNKPVLFDGNYNNLTNKPTLGTGNYNDLTNRPFDHNVSQNRLTNIAQAHTSVQIYGSDGIYLASNSTTSAGMVLESIYSNIRIAAANISIDGSNTIQLRGVNGLNSSTKLYLADITEKTSGQMSGTYYDIIVRNADTKEVCRIGLATLKAMLNSV